MECIFSGLLCLKAHVNLLVIIFIQLKAHFLEVEVALLNHCLSSGAVHFSLIEHAKGAVVEVHDAILTAYPSTSIKLVRKNTADGTNTNGTKEEADKSSDVEIVELQRSQVSLYSCYSSPYGPR